MKTPPGDLQAAGRSLWRRIVATLKDWPGGAVALDPWEVELVAEVCRAVDRCAELRRRMDGADQSAWLSLVREERQQRAILGRLVAASGLPTGIVDEQAGTGLSPASRRGQRAARARWGARHAA